MSWLNRLKDIRVGDTVRCSPGWLQTTGTYTGDPQSPKGTVTAIKGCGSTRIATIDWGNAEIPERVNVAYLSKVKQREME